MVDGGKANKWKNSGSLHTKLKDQKLKQVKDISVGRGRDCCVRATQPYGHFASGSHETSDPELIASDALPTHSHLCAELDLKFDIEHGLRQPLQCATDFVLEELPDLAVGDRQERRTNFRGVRIRNGSFTAEIRVTNREKRIWLGSFKTAEAAALAHDVATYLRAKYLGGKDPKYNFNSSPSSFPPFDEISDLNTEEEKIALIKKLAEKFAQDGGHLESLLKII